MDQNVFLKKKKESKQPCFDNKKVKKKVNEFFTRSSQINSPSIFFLNSNQSKSRINRVLCSIYNTQNKINSSSIQCFPDIYDKTIICSISIIQHNKHYLNICLIYIDCHVQLNLSLSWKI